MQAHGGWFLIDFLSTIPIDRIVLAVNNGEGGRLRLMKLIRMLRLIRLVKLIKLLKFEEFFTQYYTIMAYDGRSAWRPGQPYVPSSARGTLNGKILV